MAKYEDAPSFLIKELKSKVTGSELKKALSLAKTIPCVGVSRDGSVFCRLWAKKR